VTLSEVIRKHVIATLEDNDYNILHTAAVLGLSRRAFYRLMTRYGIKRIVDNEQAEADKRIAHAQLIQRARAIVAQAIKDGLKRGPCESCGSTSFIEAHHDNYNKPLEIRWLCRSHHAKLHGARGQRATFI